MKAKPKLLCTLPPAAEDMKAAKKKAGGTSSSKVWESDIPLTGKAIAIAGDVVFVAGTPVEFPDGDVAAAYEGRRGGMLWLVDAKTGKTLGERTLPAPPSWDSLAVANGKVYISLTDGRLQCFGGN